MDSFEYQRLLELKELISNKKANSAERKEYMNILYRNGHISREQYNSFLSNQNTDEIIGAGLTIGAVLLATWLLAKLFD